MSSSIPAKSATNRSTYAEVAARNSEQTGEQASAPVPPQVISKESVSSDSISYTTGTESPTPGGVRVIDASVLSEINTSEEPVVESPGPSIRLDNPTVCDAGEKPPGKKRLT